MGRVAQEKCEEIVETTIRDIDFILERAGAFRSTVPAGLPYSARLETDFQTACLAREQKASGCREKARSDSDDFKDMDFTGTSVIRTANDIGQAAFQDCMQEK